jgi:xanthine dehydrogenase accessory factor
MRRSTLEALQAARAKAQPVALATDLSDGRQALIHADGADDGGFGPEVCAAAVDALASDRSRTVDTAGGAVFVHAINPPLRLLVVGAVHIAQALAPMGVHAGYRVTVIDPRRAFAADERFGGVEVTTEWPDEALERLAPDTRTAVVTLTHDPKLDDVALGVALASPVFYIGSLGSTRTHRSRLARLAERGFDETALARIHGPVGLDIGARSPAEIAISILAQMTVALRRGVD